MTIDVRQVQTAPRTSFAGLVTLLLIGYELPIFLIWSGVIPFAYRFHVLIGMTVVMAIYAVIRHHSWADLGFTTATLRVSLIVNIGLSIISTTPLLVLYLT